MTLEVDTDNETVECVLVMIERVLKKSTAYAPELLEKSVVDHVEVLIHALLDERNWLLEHHADIVFDRRSEGPPVYWIRGAGDLDSYSSPAEAMRGAMKRETQSGR